MVKSAEKGSARDIRRARGAYARLVKPVFDRVGAAFLLVFLGPVAAGVALAVRSKMGAPVLYRQQRVGKNGKVIEVLKFRSMMQDRREREQSFNGVDRRVVHKSDDDPRHTKLGLFLRKTSLDELPQLLQVLSGDMSLVGPRPELVSVVETKYEPWQHARHQVKPGLTGLWQVTTRHDGSLMYEHTNIDLDYIARMSLAFDIRILFATPLVAIGRGASSIAPSTAPRARDGAEVPTVLTRDETSAADVPPVLQSETA